MPSPVHCFQVVSVCISSSHSLWGPSRRCTTMSMVDGTPPEVSNQTGGIVSGLDELLILWTTMQVGDATCGLEVGWMIRWCRAEEPCLPVCRHQAKPHAQIQKCIDRIGDGTVKSDWSIVILLCAYERAFPTGLPSTSGYCSVSLHYTSVYVICCFARPRWRHWTAELQADTGNSVAAVLWERVSRQSSRDVWPPARWLSAWGNVLRLLQLGFLLCSVLFFIRPRPEGWPHYGHTFSIYLCPLSFWLTLPRRVLSTSWCCLSRPCMAFVACMHLSLFLVLSLLQAAPLFFMVWPYYFLALTVSNSSLFTPALLSTHSFVFFAVRETHRIFLSISPERHSVSAVGIWK